MGAAKSKNIVEQAVKNIISNSNSIVQVDDLSFAEGRCKISGNAKVTNNATFSGLTIVDEFDDLDVKVTNETEVLAKQTADAVSQNLSLNPEGTEAKNINDSLIKMSTDVRNAIKQECKTSITEYQNIHCYGDAEIKDIASIENDIAASATSSCKQITSIKNDTLNELYSVIDQTAKAKQEDAILKAAVLGAVLLVIVIFASRLGGSALLRKILPYLSIMVGILSSIYLFRDCTSENPYLCKTPQVYYIISSIALLLLLGVFKAIRRNYF